MLFLYFYIKTARSVELRCNFSTAALPEKTHKGMFLRIDRTHSSSQNLGHFDGISSDKGVSFS